MPANAKPPRRRPVGLKASTWLVSSCAAVYHPAIYFHAGHGSMSVKAAMNPIRDRGQKHCIIFIHGVLSNSEKGWTSKTGIHWPTLICEEPEFDYFDIFSYNYTSDIWSRGYRMDDAAQLLQDYLVSTAFDRYETLVFVCHSMGGIIARRCIVRSERELTGKKVGLLLVASPSMGSDYANYMAPVSKLFGHTQGQALSSIETNQWLQSLDSDFISVKERAQITVIGKELIEHRLLGSKKWIGLKQVVTYYSANRYFGDPLKIPESDHITIAKPESKESPQHMALCNFLRTVNKTVPPVNHAALSNALLGVKKQLLVYQSLDTRVLGILDCELGKTLPELINLLLPLPVDKTDATHQLSSAIGNLVTQGKVEAAKRKNDYHPLRYIRLQNTEQPLSPSTPQQVDSIAWLDQMAEKLEHCSYARMHLQSFDHPDDFVPEHRAQLERIINIIQSKIDNHRDIKILAHRTDKQRSGVDWLRSRLSDSINIEEFIIIKKSRSTPSTASMCVFADGSAIYNARHNDSTSYYVQQFQGSIVHETMRIGIEHLFANEP
jgi:pimeloyl-ACP methyl ester carboxylesterase